MAMSSALDKDLERDVTPPSGERHFTAQQLADALQAHVTTVRRHIRAKKIQVIRCGGLIRIPESELTRLRS